MNSGDNQTNIMQFFVQHKVLKYFFNIYLDKKRKTHFDDEFTSMGDSRCQKFRDMFLSLFFFCVFFSHFLKFSSVW